MYEHKFVLTIVFFVHILLVIEISCNNSTVDIAWCSMPITKEDVLRVGDLAFIKLTDSDVEYYVAELARVLHWVEQLKEVDTTNTEPMCSVLSTLRELAPDIAVQIERGRRDIVCSGHLCTHGTDGMHHDALDDIVFSKGCDLPMRKDVDVATNNRDEVLRNASNSKYGYFVVPKIVG